MQGLPEANADLILLDYDLGYESGIDLLDGLETSGKPARILFVTAGMGQNVAFDVLGRGIAGIIMKHSGTDQLVDAIRRVMRGEVYLDPKVISAAQHSIFPEFRPALQRSFTDRQKEVLRGILSGLTNREIAVNLGTSETSVKAVVQELFRKTGVHTRSQLVRVALEPGSLK
jgi:two-component system, NarL family, nitrate/nitrite response regulator NarL